MKVTVKKIRQNVFETNSSSSHSISISDKNDSDLMDNSLIPDENGNVTLEGGQFGFGTDDYYDAQSKASYMGIYAIEWAKDESENFQNILIDVIKKQTGCKEVIFKFSKDYDDENWSYIDHQSVESEDYHYVFYNPEELRQFIFNKKSYLHTDSDS
jgi:hypothetical protein